MATVNFGKVKQVWRGTYAGGTAYTVDDIVFYNGQSYVCTADSTGNLPTNTSYWGPMNTGSDISGIAGLSANDMLYWTGSVWDRVAIGSADQALKVNSGATGFEYGQSGYLVNVGFWEDTSNRTFSGDNATIISAGTSFYTKQSATSYLYCIGEFRGTNNQGNDCSTAAVTLTDGSGNAWRNSAGYMGNTSHNNSLNPYHWNLWVGGTTYRVSGSANVAAAGSITIGMVKSSFSGSGNNAWTQLNPNSSNDNRLWGNTDSRAMNTMVTIYEVEPQ